MQNKNKWYRPVVLNRWSADRCRSALAFLPVHNNLFQFYTLKRCYQFRIKTVLKEYTVVTISDVQSEHASHALHDKIFMDYMTNVCAMS